MGKIGDGDWGGHSQNAGEHWAMSGGVEALCCPPETNMTLYAN